MVVAIIGVLAAVAIPAYDKYKVNSAQNSAKSSAKIIYKAAQVCRSDSDTVTSCAGNLKGTLDKTCVAGSAADIADGTCIIASAATKLCVAVSVSTKTYCIDNTVGESDTKKKCTADGECA
ncbi:MAG: type IV pilin protein [Bdellovibrionales bacterium]